MRRVFLSAIACSVVALTSASVLAEPAVFQWSLPFEYTRKDKPRESRVWLWVPPDAEQVRGIIVAGKTSMEVPFSKHPLVREAAAEQQLAILFCMSGLGSLDLQTMLDRLADHSGYQELSVAPLMFVGHSAGGPQAKALAQRHAERCFSLIQTRGGVPWMGEGEVPGEVPALVLVGEFDEFGGTRDQAGREAWMNTRDAIADKRSADDPGSARLLTYMLEPGAGHFAFSDKAAAFTAKWIAAAAAARVPAAWDADAEQPPTLNRIDPASGWLTDLAIESDDAHGAAAYADYAGDRGRTSWHFNGALAEASEAFHEGVNREDQFIEWKDRYWVDAGTRFFFTSPKWVAADVVEVHPVYADAYPGQHNGHGPKWPKAGEAVGHSEAPIELHIVGGPLDVVEDDAGGHRMRIVYDALNPVGVRARPTFLAYSRGDKTYRYTERVGMLTRNFQGFNKGKDQAITFAKIADVKRGGGPVKLEATSDAGLPVSYYVAWGPATIEGDTLTIAELPARAELPIEVAVVAYQVGSGVEPHVKTAAPVERVFNVVAE